MRLGFFSILVLLCACGGQSQGAEAEPKPGSPSPSAAPQPQVVLPAGAEPSGANAVIGATPGPCGSTRATRFLGQAYRPEMDSELIAASGAVAIRVAAPIAEDAPEEPTVDRRLNLVLNDFGQIILMDCG